MTAPIPYMTPNAPAGFKDQKPLLMVIGLLLIAMGALLGCAAAFQPLIADRDRTLDLQSAEGMARLIADVLRLGIISVCMIWGGIGCFMARRWVRPIGIAVCCIFVYITSAAVVLSGILWILFVSHFRHTTGATTAQLDSIVRPALVSYALGVTFFIVIPAALLWFLRRPSVRDTVAHYDPRIRWSDARPFPVLAIAIATMLVAVASISNSATYEFFGIVMSGLPAILATAAQALVLALLAFCAWRQSKAAWIALVGVNLGFILSLLISIFMRPHVEFTLEGSTSSGGFGQDILSMAYYNKPIASALMLAYFLPPLLYLMRHRRLFDFGGSGSEAAEA
jgi:hypothetical protein